jgi:hypothetical protein
MPVYKNFAFCNNCGKYGHLYHQCKSPITSIGIITYTISPDGDMNYLLIRRKNTFGYVDFMRGRYKLNNISYLKIILDLMTITEKNELIENDFSYLWNKLWGDNAGIQYRGEERLSTDLFNTLKTGIWINNTLITLKTLISESTTSWEFPEWGFPKGRRNYQERDLACGVREFVEETGYGESNINIVNNLIPFEEIFTGSNCKSYKHKYYLAYMDYSNISSHNFDVNNNEVGLMKWCSIENCLQYIRPYNLEKLNVIKNIDNIVKNYMII